MLSLVLMLSLILALSLMLTLSFMFMPSLVLMHFLTLMCLRVEVVRTLNQILGSESFTRWLFGGRVVLVRGGWGVWVVYVVVQIFLNVLDSLKTSNGLNKYLSKFSIICHMSKSQTTPLWRRIIKMNLTL